jgi:hypothetical protein
MSRKVIGIRAEEMRDQDEPNHVGLKRKATGPISEALAKLGHHSAAEKLGKRTKLDSSIELHQRSPEETSADTVPMKPAASQNRRSREGEGGNLGKESYAGGTAEVGSPSAK